MYSINYYCHHYLGDKLLLVLLPGQAREALLLLALVTCRLV